MYKTLHKKQGSVTVQLRFARSSVTFCAKRDNNDTDDQITKGIMLVDGKVVDKNSLVVVKKIEAV